MTPILVVLPGDVNPWCIHRPTWPADAKEPGPGWQITGDLDHLDELTVSPSIDVYHSENGRRVRTIWHGHLTKGRLG